MSEKPTTGPFFSEVSENGTVIIWAQRSGSDDQHMAIVTVGPVEQRIADAEFIVSAMNLYVSPPTQTPSGGQHE